VNSFPNKPTRALQLVSRDLTACCWERRGPACARFPCRGDLPFENLISQPPSLAERVQDGYGRIVRRAKIARQRSRTPDQIATLLPHRLFLRPPCCGRRGTTQSGVRRQVGTRSQRRLRSSAAWNGASACLTDQFLGGHFSPGHCSIEPRAAIWDRRLLLEVGSLGDVRISPSLGAIRTRAAAVAGHA
jgi:hypothetical protein